MCFGILTRYNRHDFMVEKRAAFDKLASMIANILNPPSGNVVPLRA
jgi:hypothetical protein